MSIEELAKRLSDPKRAGLSPELADRLGVGDEDITKARLMGQREPDRSHLGVYLLGAYVVDDTDFWGDGEIYWWSIPALVDRDGRAVKNPLHGLPMGEVPHKVGSQEWMTSLSLASPPLLAIIPPDDRFASCVLRLAFYDDDGAVADVPKALSAGLERFAELPSEPVSGTEPIIRPVRDAIWTSLKAQQDDILIDQDLTLRRGEVSNFGCGIIGSEINAMIRVYYFVRDENRTEQFGPVVLHKGQTENVKFTQPMRGGGRVALFARGADVNCSTFGDLNTDRPFQNRVVEARNESFLAHGFNIDATGAAKFVAYYTPP
jgi:hypothetical protein